MTAVPADAVPGDAVPSPEPAVKVEFEIAEHDGIVWPEVPKPAPPKKL